MVGVRSEGFDERRSSGRKTSPGGLGKDLAGLRIGVPRSWFSDRLNEEVRASHDKVIAFYRDHGAVIVDMDLPTARLGVPVYYVVACAEASSNLSRYDGIRYGYRAKDCKTMDELIRRSRNEGLGAEPKRRIMIGTYVLSHGYYDAYYLKAQKVRRLIADEFRTAFASVDAIISPVAPASPITSARRATRCPPTSATFTRFRLLSRVSPA